MRFLKPDTGLKFTLGAYFVLLAYSYKQELKDYSEYKKKHKMNKEIHLKMMETIDTLL